MPGAGWCGVAVAVGMDLIVAPCMGMDLTVGPCMGMDLTVAPCMGMDLIVGPCMGMDLIVAPCMGMDLIVAPCNPTTCHSQIPQPCAPPPQACAPMPHQLKTQVEAMQLDPGSATASSARLLNAQGVPTHTVYRTQTPLVRCEGEHPVPQLVVAMHAEAGGQGCSGLAGVCVHMAGRTRDKLRATSSSLLALPAVPLLTSSASLSPCRAQAPHLCRHPRCAAVQVLPPQPAGGVPRAPSVAAPKLPLGLQAAELRARHW